jgi:sec-independent protein translocase protein TatC
VKAVARRIRPVGHEEHLTLVEHLDELRTRIIITLAFLAVAFAVCFWQHDRLLDLLGRPLRKEEAKQIAKGDGTEGQIGKIYHWTRGLGHLLERLAGTVGSPSSGLHSALRGSVASIAKQATHIVSAIPQGPPPALPTTIGIGEPFTVTITVCFYFALLFTLPVLLYQLYAFVIPAFSPQEQAVARPVLFAVPGLFLLGVLFGYYIVLPAAVHFLQGFNAGSFNELVQASSYYSFSALIMLAMGVIFQVPLLVVAVARAGIVSTRQLRKHRRYAIVVAALVAAILPGDAITMTLETVPIVVLYEVGILVATLLERRDARAERARDGAAASGPPSPPPPPPPPPIQYSDAL